MWMYASRPRMEWVVLDAESWLIFIYLPLVVRHILMNCKTSVGRSSLLSGRLVSLSLVIVSLVANYVMTVANMFNIRIFGNHL